MSRSLLRAPFPVVALCLFGLVACRDDRGASSEATEPGSRALLIARADSFELDTPYEPPPGEAIDHHTSGFAKTLCSNVFISGFDVADAAENTGGFTAPFDERHHVVDRSGLRQRESLSHPPFGGDPDGQAVPLSRLHQPPRGRGLGLLRAVVG